MYRKLTLFDVLDNLDNVKQVGRGSWVASCPCHHPDKSPSLSVSAGDRVPFLLHCFSCGATFDELRKAIEARAAGVRA